MYPFKSEKGFASCDANPCGYYCQQYHSFCENTDLVLI